jgi:hypothetical protein
MAERPVARSRAGEPGDAGRLTRVEELHPVLGRVDAISASISSADVKAGILLTRLSVSLRRPRWAGHWRWSAAVVRVVWSQRWWLLGSWFATALRFDPWRWCCVRGFGRFIGANRFAFPSLARWPGLAAEPMDVDRLCREAMEQMMTVADRGGQARGGGEGSAAEWGCHGGVRVVLRRRGCVLLGVWLTGRRSVRVEQLLPLGVDWRRSIQVVHEVS